MRSRSGIALETRRANCVRNVDSLFCTLTEVEHGVLQERMLAVVDHRPGLVNAVLLESDVVVRLPPLLARAQPLVLQVFLMVRLVDGRHVVGHATDRYVILMLGDYVIGMVVGLNVIRVIRLRLNRLRDLGHVILMMIDPLVWFVIDLQVKQAIRTLII